MSAYRFCRTDDIPLLVEALNACSLPHTPGAAPATAADLKRDIRELDLWCSSCMVAFEGSDPIGVLIGCKRPPHTLVRRIAVRPDHVRRGHARHLLTSLSAKLAILGPKLLAAEVDALDAPARALFEACGWREERRYADFTLDPSLAEPAPRGIVQVAAADEVTHDLLPADDASRSWERIRGTLVKRMERLSALAIASMERLEAAALYSKEIDRVAVWSLSAVSDDALATLLRDLAHRERAPVVIPGIGDEEIEARRLLAIGLTREAEQIGFGAEARKA